jgi:murein DD-endopeptidase MepM/ murein hydrolase activator NlpD
MSRSAPVTLILVALLVAVGGYHYGTLQASETAPPPPEPAPQEPVVSEEPMPGEPFPVRQAQVERAALGKGLDEEAMAGTWHRLDFLVTPIDGARVSEAAGQLPGAPRTYRNGVHQGLDFYGGYCGVDVQVGTPVLAAGDGLVTRADTEFREMTLEQREQYLNASIVEGETPDDILDSLNGRQVWIQHRDGVVTRYSHLESIAPGIETGTRVKSREVIGFVGNSGTSDGVMGTSEGAHLHFEVIVNGRVFFDGMTPEQVHKTLERLL